MRTFFILLATALMLFTSCGRRTLPTQTTSLTTNRPPIAPDRIDNDKKYVIRASPNATKVEGNENVDANIKANAGRIPAATEKAMAVIDSKGNVVVSAESLPAYVSHNLDSISMSVRSYTPNQAKNLSSRYNVIPPRVIYVPENLQRQGTRGAYFLYKVASNALWYWKKAFGEWIG